VITCVIVFILPVPQQRKRKRSQGFGHVQGWYSRSCQRLNLTDEKDRLYTSTAEFNERRNLMTFTTWELTNPLINVNPTSIRPQGTGLDLIKLFIYIYKIYLIK